MAHIPTYCDLCSTSTLLPASAIQSGRAACDSCGADVRPIPGASYVEGDVPLYAELASALRAAGITPFSAVQLLDQASAASSAPPGQLLKYLAGKLPSLSVFETYSPSDRLQKINAMLATLLNAVGSGRTSEPAEQPDEIG